MQRKQRTRCGRSAWLCKRTQRLWTQRDQRVVASIKQTTPLVHPLFFRPEKESHRHTSSRVDTTHWRSRTYKYVFKSEGEGSLGGRVHVGVNGGLCGARTGSPTQPRENYSTNEWAFVYFFFFWKSFPFDIAGDMIYLRFNTYVKIWRKIMRCFQ